MILWCHFPLCLRLSHSAVAITSLPGNDSNTSRPFGNTADHFIYCWFHFRFSFPLVFPPPGLPTGFPFESPLSPISHWMTLTAPHGALVTILLQKYIGPQRLSPLALLLRHRSLCWYRSFLPSELVLDIQKELWENPFAVSRRVNPYEKRNT